MLTFVFRSNANILDNIFTNNFLSLSSFTSLSDFSRTESDIVDKKSNMPSFASMSLISFLKMPSLLIYLNSRTCSMVSNLLKLKNNSLSGSPHCRRLTFVKFFVVFLAKKSQRMVFLALFCPKIYPYFLSRVIILYTFAFLF